MLRFIVVAVILFGFLGGSVGKLHRLKELAKSNPNQMEEESLRIVRKMFRLILHVVGVSVTVKGMENIPKGQPVLYVGNHRSYFDILVGYTTVPGKLGFVAKKEMLRYPFLSDWMVNVNCLFLDRKNIKEGLKAILEGIEKVKRGVSIWIFPEGTRNRSEDILELLPFKEGSFKMAEKTGCAIIPMAMVHTADIFEKHVPFVKRTRVTLTYGEPIYVKQLDKEQRKHLGSYVQDVIRGMLEEQLKEEL